MQTEPPFSSPNNPPTPTFPDPEPDQSIPIDRKSTRLNSSHVD
jgi:hypothetical protein